jgi:hypothetical protein
VSNSAALVKESIWRDKDFRRLPRLSQCTYQQLLAQKEIDRAGLFRLHTRSLLRGCEELTEEQLYIDLEMLEIGRFLFVDPDTDEGFIRSYMRTFNVAKYPQYLANAIKGARMVESLKIRHEVALELQRLKVTVASDAAAEIHNPEQCPHCDGTVPAPCDDVPAPFTVPAPSSGSTRSSEVALVSTSVGEQQPSEFCPKHPNGTEKNCFACGQARRDYPELMAVFEQCRREAAAATRQAAIDDCLVCDEFGDITFDDSVRKCDHQAAAHA